MLLLGIHGTRLVFRFAMNGAGTYGFYNNVNMMHQYGAGNQDVLLMSNSGVEPVSALGGRCPANVPVRQYDISAINVEISLNMWLDFYPGYMYVLTEHIDKVREEGNRSKTTCFWTRCILNLIQPVTG